MLSKVSLIAFVAAIGMTASTAKAADFVPVVPPPTPAPIIVPEPAFDWAGFYVGGLAGWGFGSADWVYVSEDSFDQFHTRGPIAGGTVGFNVPLDNFLVGFEGDLAWARIRGTFECPDEEWECEASLRWLGTARARAGIVHDNWLIFGTVGLAVAGQRAQSTNTFGDPFPPSGTPVNGTNDTVLGLVVGGGVEVAIGESVSIKLDALHYRLQTGEHVIDDNQDITLRQRGVVVRFGINWHL